MLSKIITALLLIVGIINIFPLMGIISAEQLTVLYGLDFHENNLLILMQHRALLFGLLGAFIVYAAFRPFFQPLAFICGMISMSGFIILSWRIGHHNNLITKVVIIDIIAILLLIVAVILFIINQKKENS